MPGGLNRRLRGHGAPLPILCPKARQRHAEQLPDRCQTCLRNRWPCAWNGQKAGEALCRPLRFLGTTGAVSKPLTGPWLTLTVAAPGPVFARPAGEGFLRAVHLTRVVLHDLEAMVEAGQVPHLAPPPNETWAGGKAGHLPCAGAQETAHKGRPGPAK